MTVDYLRERVSALESLVDENVKLSARIGELESEVEQLRAALVARIKAEEDKADAAVDAAKADEAAAMAALINSGPQEAEDELAPGADRKPQAEAEAITQETLLPGGGAGAPVDHEQARGASSPLRGDLTPRADADVTAQALDASIDMVQGTAPIGADKPQVDSASGGRALPPPCLLDTIRMRQSEIGDVPKVLLVGDPAFLVGGGPTFEHREIRDLLAGIPHSAALSLLAVDGGPRRGGSPRRSRLRDGAAIFDINAADAGDWHAVLAAFSPDLIMNVGPLRHSLQLFRRIPQSMRGVSVLNLIHEEVANLASLGGASLMDRAQAALVTTNEEKKKLVDTGFDGDIFIYRRGVDTTKHAVADIAGQNGLLFVADGDDGGGGRSMIDVISQLRAKKVRVFNFSAKCSDRLLGVVDYVEAPHERDLIRHVAQADAVLVPEGTLGLPQALQVALTMGKVCLLPQEPFAGSDVAEIPALRYDSHAAALSKVVGDILKNPKAYEELGAEAANYARTHFKRSACKKNLGNIIDRFLVIAEKPDPSEGKN